MEPARVLKKYLVKLLSLPLRQPKFIALLKSQDLLPGSTENKIHSKDTEADAALYFVNEIEKSLRISCTNFDKLLFVMKEYGDTMLTLAQQMEKDLKEPPLLQQSPQPEPKGTYLLLIKFINIYST